MTQVSRQQLSDDPDLARHSFTLDASPNVVEQQRKAHDGGVVETDMRGFGDAEDDGILSQGW